MEDDPARGMPLPLDGVVVADLAETVRSSV
jgi:hypothetical protein